MLVKGDFGFFLLAGFCFWRRTERGLSIYIFEHVYALVICVRYVGFILSGNFALLHMYCINNQRKQVFFFFQTELVH